MGEIILSAENSRKPLGDRGSAPNPAGGAHSAPPELVGRGLLPFPKNPTSQISAFGLDFRPLGLGSQ